ncbi:DUF947-domain-containing protein [Cryptosporidium felis]|nr:DUF947-domain-containing protein [Cryptosporidium felis]
MNFGDIPFEEILKKERMARILEEKRNKKPNSKGFGDYQKVDCINSKQENKQKFQTVTSTRNMPTEVSSRREVLPKSLENERNSIRNKHLGLKKNSDPRFNESCGKFNADLFQKSYHFLEDIRNEEYNQIKNTLDLYKIMNKSKELGTWSKVKKSSKFKNSSVSHLTQDQIDELKLKFQRLISERNHRKNLFLKQKTISSHRKQEQAKIESGKKPFFLKQRDIHASVQNEKYKNLSRSKLSKLERKNSKKQLSKFKPPKSLRNL